MPVGAYLDPMAVARELTPQFPELASDETHTLVQEHGRALGLKCRRRPATIDTSPRRWPRWSMSARCTLNIVRCLSTACTSRPADRQTDVLAAQRRSVGAGRHHRLPGSRGYHTQRSYPQQIGLRTIL